jgi:hypothetical protein
VKPAAAAAAAGAAVGAAAVGAVAGQQQQQRPEKVIVFSQVRYAMHTKHAHRLCCFFAGNTVFVCIQPSSHPDLTP